MYGSLLLHREKKDQPMLAAGVGVEPTMKKMGACPNVIILPSLRVYENLFNCIKV
jgi:hypothetical protein